jgi:hypothetical protein
MTIAKFSKTPLERTRYVMDYSDWLDTGETITHIGYGVVPNDDPADLTVDTASLSPDKLSGIFFANGGIDGVTYRVTVQANTSGSQIKRDQVVFNVKALPGS